MRPTTSSGLDQLQLVDERVHVLTTRVGVTDTVTYDPTAVRDRYGVTPEQLPDWKAIVGDTSDNIPGVPGIGEKGATALIQQFGSVESLIERLQEAEPKYLKKLEAPGVIEQLKKSKWLATICRTAEVAYGFEPFAVTEEQVQKARAFLEYYELRSHVKRLPQVLAPYIEGGSIEPIPVEVVSEAIEATHRSAKSLEDLETWIGGRPYSLFLGSTSAQASMFEEGAAEAFIGLDAEVARVPEPLALEFLGAVPGQAVVHDAKPLIKKARTGLQPVGFDTMLAGYVLQSGRSSYALRDLVQGYLDLTPPTKPEEMAVALYRLRATMESQLRKESQEKVLFDIEQPLTPILAEMESFGIQVSRPFLENFSGSLQVQIAASAARVYELAGEEFNIGSPKQLGEVLFEKLKIPGQKKTKTGYATGAEILQFIDHPIAKEILNWRELSKLRSTYADSLPRMIAQDGRIHTTYAQAVAATGRLSSNDPNLQNIPIRTDLGREIRKAFVAAAGTSLVSLDYSQIELRILAHYCKDPNLLRAFETGEDVHTVTASVMFDAGREEVSKTQRGYAKLLNYAVLYGVTDFGLANQLGGDFSVTEARTLIENYYSRFPSVKAFMDGIVAEARSKGFTTTLCGRRRYFPEIHAANRNERLGAERQAMNAPMQGTAADMIKLAMVDVRGRLDASATRMLLQVHDELLFEMPHDDRALIEPIRGLMENALPMDVRVEVDAKAGPNWGEMTPLDRG
ncbi:MAG: DNA polymerase I [Armatimonadetes bacterium]|nr:DNA polymerase I [Armatimonadota bacterium]